MNKIEQAIRWAQQHAYTDKCDASDYTIATLKEKQEQDKGCEYCTTADGQTIYRTFYKNLFNQPDLVCIAHGRRNHPSRFYLHIETDDDGGGDCEIFFCPHCGRKLGVEGEQNV